MTKEKDLKPGDHVEWRHMGAKPKGEVKGKITQDKKIAKHQVRASPQSPQVEVASDKTGKRAAHKPKSLKKIDK